MFVQGPSQEKLANLKLYKYASVDKSLVSRYVLRHYWNWAIRLFPMSMAPNLITLSGFMFIIINVILAAIYVPSLDIEAGAPHWIYFSFAAGLWLYSTFDNVDGRQARRTGTSSPLGELFDHGCDALNCMFSAVLQAAALGTGHSRITILLCVVEAYGFYLSTAEEYNTGVLYLGYINAPTEGIIVACIVFIITGCYGPAIWRNTVSQVFQPSWLPASLANLSLSHAILGSVLLITVTTHIPMCFYGMYTACRKNNKPALKTIVTQNMPVIVYCASIYAWTTSPFSFILSHHYFILFAVTTGIVFGRMASKIILAHLTKASFPMFTVLLVPLVSGAVLANLPRIAGIPPLFTPQSELLYLISFFVFALVAYLKWAVVVINSICTYLDIRCLTIRKQKI